MVRFSKAHYSAPLRTIDQNHIYEFRNLQNQKEKVIFEFFHQEPIGNWYWVAIFNGFHHFCAIKTMVRYGALFKNAL